MTESKRKGTGTTVQTDLREHPALLSKIRAAAKADDREVSSWLRRQLIRLEQEGYLFPVIGGDATLPFEPLQPLPTVKGK